MGFGSSGGVRARRLPVVLIYLTISCMFLLGLSACGGEEPTPVPPPTTAPVVIAAPPVQPAPTLPPLPAEEPVAEPSGPVSTPLVIVPGNRFGSRAPAEEPTLAPTEEPTPEPQPEPEPTATSLPRPTPTVVIRPNLPTETPVPVRNPSITLNPASGQPGISVTVAGTDFAPGSTVGSVNFGGITASPSPPVTVDSLGSFYATIVVPDVAAGNYNLTMTVGSDTGSASFTLQAAPSGPQVPAGSPIITTLAPLAGNLQWVAYFDNTTKSWSLYDPTGTFDPGLLPAFIRPPADLGAYSPLTSLNTSLSYYWNLQRAATVQIAGKAYEFTAGQNVK